MAGGLNTEYRAGTGRWEAVPWGVKPWRSQTVGGAPTSPQCPPYVIPLGPSTAHCRVSIEVRQIVLTTALIWDDGLPLIPQWHSSDCLTAPVFSGGKSTGVSVGLVSVLAAH